MKKKSKYADFFSGKQKKKPSLWASNKVLSILSTEVLYKSQTVFSLYSKKERTASTGRVPAHSNSTKRKQATLKTQLARIWN